MGLSKLPNEIFKLPELIVVVHPGLEALLVVVGPVLEGVGGKADEVEVTLHEVQDHAFPTNLHSCDQFCKNNVKGGDWLRTCLSSGETSYFHFDSMIASLMFWRPVPFGVGPQMSITWIVNGMMELMKKKRVFIMLYIYGIYQS